MIEGLFVAIDQYNRSRIEQGRAAELFARPAVIAKYRLQQVMAADRAAVPTGRWVRRLDQVAFNLFRSAFLFGLPTWPAFLSGRDTGKPRYRWERRQ